MAIFTVSATRRPYIEILYACLDHLLTLTCVGCALTTRAVLCNVLCVCMCLRQVSGHAIQWQIPFHTAGRMLFFAQVQTTSDSTPSIVRYTDLTFPQPPTAASYGGATIIVEDAGCGETRQVRVADHAQTRLTCCTGVAQPGAGHPARAAER
eukprot:COSAG02_NODE_3298_length_6991_cov_2.515525_2_plen_152_part_00